MLDAVIAEISLNVTAVQEYPGYPPEVETKGVLRYRRRSLAAKRRQSIQECTNKIKLNGLLQRKRTSSHIHRANYWPRNEKVSFAEGIPSSMPLHSHVLRWFLCAPPLYINLKTAIKNAKCKLPSFRLQPRGISRIPFSFIPFTGLEFRAVSS